MSAMNTPAYAELTRLQQQIYQFLHVSKIIGWDRNAMMPAKGNEARAAAEAEVDAHIHALRTSPAQRELLDRAEGENLGDIERANLREMRREWRLANALPESLVKEIALAGARCEHAWRTQRKANDCPRTKP
jgi:carboxypeptidase Taq